jgi:hypothetical protein
MFSPSHAETSLKPVFSRQNTHAQDLSFNLTGYISISRDGSALCGTVYGTSAAGPDTAGMTRLDQTEES